MDKGDRRVSTGEGMGDGGERGFRPRKKRSELPGAAAF